MRDKPAGQIKEETGASHSALTILARDYGLKREKKHGIFVYNTREVLAKMAERKADARKKRRAVEEKKAAKRAARYGTAESKPAMVPNWASTGEQDAVKVERRGTNSSTKARGWFPKPGGYFAELEMRNTAKHAAESEARTRRKTAVSHS